MLAIVTPTPDNISDTFIRQHIRLIMPDKTVVIFFRGKGDTVKNLKTLKIEQNSNENFRRKIINFTYLIWDGYSGSLKGFDRKNFILFIKKNGVKMVLAEHGQTACAVKSACKSANVKLFVYFHGYDATGGARSLIKRFSYWRLGRSADRIFVGTNYFKEKVNKLGIDNNKISVVPCGIEAYKFGPSKNREENLIIAVGRMVEKKAPHLTVEAFADVVKKIPEARLEMIGDGPMKKLAEDTARRLCIADKIIFHGK